MKNTIYLRVAVLFLASLAFFNIAFISSGGWARLTWNTAGYLTLFAVYKLAGLRRIDIGLATNKLKPGLKFGGLVILLIGALLSIVYAVDPAIFEDTRYKQSLSSAFFASLVLLPLKTVLFEEFAFRGILPALLLKIKNRQLFAMMGSSFAFGLWHIFSATKIGQYHLGDFQIPNVAVVFGVFIATFTAGMILYELRRRSDSLIASIVVHWFINASAIILAALSWR